MQMLQTRSTRSQLPMSNTARRQLGLSPQQLRIKTKNDHLPSHDLCIAQDVMFQDSISKRWFSVTIQSQCKDPRSYKVITRDGVTYRKTQAHLKPYRPQSKQHEAGHSISKKCNMQTVRSECKTNKSDNLDPRGTLIPPVRLDLW